MVENYKDALLYLMGFNPGFTEVLPGVGGKGRRGFATLSLENEREQNRPDIPVGKEPYHVRTDPYSKIL